MRFLYFPTISSNMTHSLVKNLEYRENTEKAFHEN